jgi:hypothetical protein
MDRGEVDEDEHQLLRIECEAATEANGEEEPELLPLVLPGKLLVRLLVEVQQNKPNLILRLGPRHHNIPGKGLDINILPPPTEVGGVIFYFGPSKKYFYK